MATTTTTVPDVLRMPLTGEPIDDESEIPDRPALVVKISNAPLSVLPQAGLNSADIVFEEVINDAAPVSRRCSTRRRRPGRSDPVGPSPGHQPAAGPEPPLFAWSGGNPASRGRSKSRI